MPAKHGHTPALLWCDAQHAPLLRSILLHSKEVSCTALGGPSRAGISDLAHDLNTEPLDDLRHMILDTPARWLLLATGEGAGAAELKLAAESGLRILALEPPRAFLEPEADLTHLALAPSILQSHAWLSAAEPLEELGTIRCIQLSAAAPRSAGSLYARLHESLALILQLLGEPHSIDASLSGPLHDPPPPDAPQALTGHIAAHLRYPTGSSALLHATDLAHTWSRRTTLHGEKATLTLDDRSYTLTAIDGTTLDSLHPPRKKHDDPAQLIADQWKRLRLASSLGATGGLSASAPAGSDGSKATHPRPVTAACQATLLSCKTTQPESPSTFLRNRNP